MKTTISAALLATLLAGGAQASSDDAWATFAADVKAKCSQAVKSSLADAAVVVDPFGSQSYGLALATGALKADKGQNAAILCVYDKKTRTVEIGGELGADVLKVTVPKQ